ncbi:hypothetical protein KUCAC02_031623, partial [Chaenocephalus aceratus]
TEGCQSHRLESFQPEAAPHKEISSTMCLRWCSHNVGSGTWRNVLVLLSRANPIVLTHSIEYLTPLSYYLASLPHTFPHTWQIQATQPEMLIEDERLMNDWAEWLHTMPTIIIAAVGRKDPERLWAAGWLREK